jgi:uncharacterized protein (UPF0335 family)
VGKPSVVLGRLTWKWSSEEHLRCLVKTIKRIEQEKQAISKRELVMANSSGIPNSSLMQELMKRRSKPTTS